MKVRKGVDLHVGDELDGLLRTEEWRPFIKENHFLVCAAIVNHKDSREKLWTLIDKTKQP